MPETENTPPPPSPSSSPHSERLESSPNAAAFSSSNSGPNSPDTPDTPDTPGTKKQTSGWLNVAVDYGPVLVFLAAYKFFSPEQSDPVSEIAAIVKGTFAFMLAAIAALIISKWKLGRVSPMLILSTALILGFGALTIFLGNPFWVQLKPTIIYALFGTVLIGGFLIWRKPMLKYVLEVAFDGLNDAGWLKLSRNFGVFFFLLAGLNEVLRHLYNAQNGGFETWLWAKIWVFMPLSILFTVTQLPMLMRHGLTFDEPKGPTAPENGDNSKETSDPN